jgi:hypothetical protein
MTRSEAPLCWFVDHEMRTLAANDIAVWMAIYGANVAHDCHVSADSLLERLHWLSQPEIEQAIGILTDRQLLAGTPYEDETGYGEVILYEAIEPTMLMEVGQ